MTVMGRKDLEGKFFVFQFGADYTVETSALSLFQVRNGKLEQLMNPCDLYPSPWGEWEFDDAGGVHDRKTREYFVKMGVKELFSLKNPNQKSFLGFKLSWYFDKNNYGGYNPLEETDFWTKFFDESGIELKFYDSRRKIVVPTPN